ncbi:MAG: type II secretion system F family protein [bacterium]|nr:type II secretion system F family protein [bacterium]
MSSYSYRARNAAGQEVKGSLQAPTEERARALLQSHSLIPLEINSGAGVRSLLNRNVLGGRVNTKDLVLISRQLSSMINAGVPVLEAIRALVKQSDKASLRQLLTDIAYDIEDGASLSQAMSKYPATFSVFYLGVVRTGEASGRLSNSLGVMADYLEQTYNFTRKIRSALMYPLFVITAVIIVVVIMFLFVMPQLTALFTEASVRLPLPTRILIAATSFFQGYWYIVVLIAIALAIITRSYLKTPEGQYTLSSLVLRIPGLKVIFQKVYLSRLTSVLHTLFLSDVPVLESLQIARESIDNKIYQRILDDTRTAVKDGASLSSVWENEPYIPPMLTATVAVGERSGEVHKAFAEAHRFFQRDVDEILSSVTVFLEPVLVVLLAIGVGIVVSAVILPIYNLVLVL